MRRVAVTKACFLRTLCGATLAADKWSQQYRSRSFKRPTVDPNTPWKTYDSKGSAGHLEKLESGSPDREHSPMSLEGDFEELSAEELDARVKSLTAAYKPTMYAMTMFPSVDIVLLMFRHGMLPKARPEEMTARFFVDPSICLKSPGKVEQVMGAERFRILTNLLEKELDDYTLASPLSRCLRRLDLPPDSWLPFVRGLLSSGLEGRENMQQFPALLLGLASGRGPADLKLATDVETRIRQLAALLIAAACEYGRTIPANLAMQLLRAHGIEPSRELQKQLTIAMGRQSSRELDWRLRVSGMLTQSVPKWLSTYRKKVDGDVSEQIAKMAAELSVDDLTSEEKKVKGSEPESNVPPVTEGDIERGADGSQGAPEDSFESLFSPRERLDQQGVNRYFAEKSASGFHEVYLTSLERSLKTKRAERTSIADANEKDKPKRKSPKRRQLDLSAHQESESEQQQRRLREAMFSL